MTEPTPVETPYGTLYVDPEELVIGRLLQADGKIPDISEEVEFFKKYLKPGDTAIDVGANYGLFTLALADIVGEEGGILAYEPNLDILPYLYLTIKECGAKFAAIHKAVGREGFAGGIRLDPRGSGGTQVIADNDGLVFGGCDQRVTVTTLDDEMTRHPHHRPIKAIKIDVEGMDVDVLLGAATILKEDRPAVIFEWNPEAMQSLGKKPVDELIQLCHLGLRTNYTVTDLSGVNNNRADRMLGNMAFLPEEHVVWQDSL